VTFAIVAGIALCQGIVFALHASFMPELFGTNVRYGGISLGFQLGAAIGGGLTPCDCSRDRGPERWRNAAGVVYARGARSRDLLCNSIDSRDGCQANALMKKTRRSSRANVHATALLETAPLGSPR
jgi:hypothetical protein